jgi:thiol:disulfide interchange protein
MRIKLFTSTPLMIASMVALALSLLGGFGLTTAPARASTLLATNQPDVVRVMVEGAVQRPVAAAGDQFAVAVTFEFAKKMHIWPNVPVIPDELKGLLAIPTLINVREGATLPDGVKVYPRSAQWPKPQEVEVGFTGSPVKLLSYAEPTTVYIPVVIEPSAKPGEITIPLTVSYQACNDAVCFQEEKVELDLKVKIVETGTVIPPAPDAALFKDFDPSVFSNLLAGNVKGPEASATREFDFLGYKFNVAANAYVLIMLIAFAAGVLMNFTPCVLPVIPIKILSIQAHAKSPGKLVWFGTVYCLGIIAMYGVLGLMAFGVITGGQKYDWGQIFTHTWFVIAMSLIVAVMGVGMMGWFTIRLPNFVYSVNPTGESTAGNFVGGVLTGILAVPCTGPLLGATLAWILTQPPALGIGVFLLMGLGMASPYALLIFFPKLLQKVPRGGPGSELLKQVMGLFMLAVAAFLAGNLTSERWPWYIVGVLSVFAFGWMVAGGRRTLVSAAAKNITTVLGVLGIAGSIWVTQSLTKAPPIDWRVFAARPDGEIRSAIAEAVKKGNVVVVDFTAKWCTNCHVIEKNVIYSEEGLKTLGAKDVVEFKVDLTKAGSEEGWGMVKEISGGGGIPLIAIFGPAVEKPIFFQSFFKPSDLTAAVAKARGAGAAGGAAGSGTGQPVK